MPREIEQLKAQLEKATEGKQKEEIRSNLVQGENYLAELKAMQITLPTLTFDHTLILRRAARTVEIFGWAERIPTATCSCICPRREC
jgi:hypothetical protein